MRRSLLAGGCSLLLVLTLSATTAAAAPAPRIDHTAVTPEVVEGLYVVLLRDEPTALQGAGTHLTAARDELIAAQDDVLASIGSPETLYRYTAAVSGFAVELTAADVKELQSDPDVLAVAPNRKATLDQAAARSATAEAGPPLAGSNAGKGVVIGVVDSGIWPENPSFAAAPLDAERKARAYPDFDGTCQVDGERWSEQACGGKLLAAQSYAKGFGEENIAAAEYLSPRDASGHGSHVAAIAAGNSGVTVTVDKQRFGRVSGGAPGAALASYKACWAAPDPADDGCTSVDTVRAIDQAVADGVDVLNLSLSDSDRLSVDPVELALLNATDAGVFVVASAGDGGPARGTVAHPGPWVTTVAATTGARYPGIVRLGDGAAVRGSMVSAERVRDRRLVYAGDAAAVGHTRRDAAHCLAGSLDASVVDGAIVLCDRGISPRVAKSETVGQAGAAAMVLANTGGASVETDIHRIPTVHVDAAERRLLLRYLRDTRRPTAALRPAPARDGDPAVADFSARGPLSDDDSDLIKPDLSATGVNVLSAVSPPADLGRLWDLSSGTSMAAAQVAGTAAAVRAKHPDWSPAAVKSALMTTARTLSSDANPLHAGAGLLRPRLATDPGLVYDTSARSWWRYLRGQGVTTADGSPVADRAEDGSDVNLASISVGTLVGTQQVTRRVTNVGDTAETYVGRVSGLHGIASRLTPSSFRLEPGQSRTFRVTFSARRTAHYDKIATGWLIWRGSVGHRVESPVAVRPDTVRAVDDVAGSGASGETVVRADAGVTGTLRTKVVGPVAAMPTSLTLQPGPFDPRSPSSSGAAARQTLEVPNGAVAARWVVESDADVDLYVYRAGDLIAASSGRSGAEQATLLQPEAGSYAAYVVAPDAGSTSPVDASVTMWAIPDRSGSGSVEVSPRRLAVTGSERFDLTVSWNRLSTDRRYLAAIQYSDSRQTTLVTIN